MMVILRFFGGLGMSHCCLNFRRVAFLLVPSATVAVVLVKDTNRENTACHWSNHYRPADWVDAVSFPGIYN